MVNRTKLDRQLTRLFDGYQHGQIRRRESLHRVVASPAPALRHEAMIRHPGGGTCVATNDPNVCKPSGLEDRAMGY